MTRGESVRKDLTVAAVRQAHPRRAHYTPVGIGFHWIMAGLIALQLFLGWRTTRAPAGYDKVELYGLHADIGLLILVLASARLVWRLFVPRPLNTEDIPGWQHLAARVTHWLLYGAMFALPLSGWMILSTTARDTPIGFFGLLEWPHLPWFETQRMLEQARWEARAQGLHQFLVWSLIALLGLHLGAALKHQFIDRDQVLARMIPWLARPEETKARRPRLRSADPKAAAPGRP